MRVKIGQNIFDSNEEPIMLIFESDKERINAAKQITHMINAKGKVRKYCLYPGSFTIEKIKHFMKI